MNFLIDFEIWREKSNKTRKPAKRNHKASHPLRFILKTVWWKIIIFWMNGKNLQFIFWLYWWSKSKYWSKEMRKIRKLFINAEITFHFTPQHSTSSTSRSIIESFSLNSCDFPLWQIWEKRDEKLNFPRTDSWLSHVNERELFAPFNFEITFTFNIFAGSRTSI